MESRPGFDPEAFPNLAQGYPTRPVRIVVPYAAGTSPDIIARLVGQALSERLGQQVIIENRTGAGGDIGTEVVVRAPADGYTLLLATGANATNAALYERLNFDFIRDIAPVAALGGVALVMVINPSFPAKKTVPDFVAYAHANPGKINMASAGSGTTVHLAVELFKIMTGVDFALVEYRGANPWTDIISGQVQGSFAVIPASLEYIKTGKVRGLAVTGATRSEVLPHVPTMLSSYRLRGQHLVWRWCAEEHFHRNYRKAQQGYQRRRHRTQYESAPCGLGPSSDAVDIC